jgi:hypothetical protein
MLCVESKLHYWTFHIRASEKYITNKHRHEKILHTTVLHYILQTPNPYPGPYPGPYPVPYPGPYPGPYPSQVHVQHQIYHKKLTCFLLVSVVVFDCIIPCLFVFAMVIATAHYYSSRTPNILLYIRLSFSIDRSRKVVQIS